MSVVSIAAARGTDPSYPVGTITVPDPFDCQPARARTTGGVNRQHPCWSPLTTQQPSIADDADWQLSGIQSKPDSSKVTFHSRRATFSFLSHKSGRTQTGESHYEFQNAQEKEVDPNVVDYQLQGIEMHWDVAGSVKRYTPDAVALDAQGMITVEEVKATPSYFADPEYRSIMTAAQTSLARIGIAFRKVTGSEMERARRRRHNVERAFMDRSTAFGAKHVAAVEELFASNPEQPMGRLKERLAMEPRIASMVVNAMMCARHLTYDLNLRIGADTLVVAPTAPATGMRDIRALSLS